MYLDIRCVYSDLTGGGSIEVTIVGDPGEDTSVRKKVQVPNDPDDALGYTFYVAAEEEEEAEAEAEAEETS